MRAYLLFDDGPLPTLDATRNALCEEALKRTNGNQVHAARMIGITVPTLVKYAYMEPAEEVPMDEELGNPKAFEVKSNFYGDLERRAHERKLTEARMARMGMRI
jgi:hypothetical protein